MAEASGRTTEIQFRLDRLRAGDGSALEELLTIAGDRLARLARKMLRGFPRVQRWEQTDDVLQNAILRLYRALESTTPLTVRDFFNLAALQTRRELIDLARHYYGPLGLGAKHASNAEGIRESWEGGQIVPSDDTYDPNRLTAWTEFHEQIDTLPDEEREVFHLLWYQGLSQAEAATVLEVSDRVVRRRWRSARIQLHKKLDGRLPF
jgi:RNA polymerase sigma-70 factor (ECF subfamily)